MSLCHQLLLLAACWKMSSLHSHQCLNNQLISQMLLNQIILRVVLVLSHSVLAISQSRDKLQCPRWCSLHTRSKHDRYHAILNQLKITKHTARRDATTFRLPVKDKTDEFAELSSGVLPSFVLPLVGLPKIPHSLKCVVVAVTTLALTSTSELSSESAVQRPDSFLYMKSSDASLTPV